MREYIIPYKIFHGSILPNWLLKMEGLSFGAKCCYARLGQYGGSIGICKPRHKVIAGELGCSAESVKRFIRELVKTDLLEKEVQMGGRSNHYIFPKHEKMDFSYKKESKATGHIQPPLQVDTDPLYRSDSTPTIKKRINEENHITTKAPNSIVTIITHYSSLKQQKFVTPESFNGHFKRHCRAAKQLIAECGGVEQAIASLDKAKKYFEDKKLDWVLSTVLNHLPTITAEKKAKGWGGNYE